MHAIRCLAVVLVLVFTGSEATAQFGTTPTDGLRLPNASITSRDDALALELNPAGLAFIQSWDANFIYTTADSDLLTGTGLFFGGRLLGRLGLGAAVQWVENPALGGHFKKFTFGVGTHFAGRAGIGLAYSFFDSDTNRLVDTFHSLDAGVQLRLTDWLGVAAAVRDFNTPRLGKTALEPRYIAGLAFRILEGRYVLELDAIRQPSEDAWYLRARTSIEPTDGFRIFAETQTSSVDDFGIESVNAGLAFTFGPSSIASAAIFDLQDDLAVGTSTSLRISGRPGRTLYQPSGFYAGITISGSLPERGWSNRLLGTQRSFLDLLRYLDRLGRDENVQGLVLTLENPSFGFGQHWELHRALEQLRARDKEVVVYMHSADFGDVYLASAADQVFVAPGISYFPRGISTRLTYLGELFDNVGVEPEFVRIAEYKTVPETLSEAEPSEYALEAVNAYYDDSFGHMVSAIAAGRGLADEEVIRLIDETPLSPSSAMERGLADGVCFRDELDEKLGETLGRRVRIADNYNPDWQRDYRWVEAPTVAVVYVDGDIIAGTSGALPIVGQVAGHRSIIASLETAASTSGVIGIVLRVDSPGGSAWASEQIWRAVHQANERVPVVVSMGDVAASGGYYVAAGGSEIFATEMTVTGSIGIFSGHFSAQELLETIGVHRFPILRGAYSNLFGIDRPWSDPERDAAMRDIRLMYDVFLTRVADNREWTTEEVDSVGRGRVWSGTRASENGLIDQLGGLMDAIDRAKALAGLEPDDEIQILALPEPTTLAMITGAVGMRAALDADSFSSAGPIIEALGLDQVLRFPILYGDGQPAARMEFELLGEE